MSVRGILLSKLFPRPTLYLDFIPSTQVPDSHSARQENAFVFRIDIRQSQTIISEGSNFMKNIRQYNIMSDRMVGQDPNTKILSWVFPGGGEMLFVEDGDGEAAETYCGCCLTPFTCSKRQYYKKVMAYILRYCHVKKGIVCYIIYIKK